MQWEFGHCWQVAALQGGRYSGGVTVAVILIYAMILIFITISDICLSEENSVVYLAGYLARKARDKKKIEQCIKLWIAGEEEKAVLNE